MYVLRLDMGCAYVPSLVRCGARATKQRRGTTLIELLVVISLIALLVGMLVPSLKRSMLMAHTMVCTANLSEVGRSLMMYRTEHRGWLPVDRAPVEFEDGETVASRNEAGSDVWFLKLFPNYLTDLGVLICPEDPFGFRLRRAQWQLDNSELAEFPSYGMSSFIMAGRGGGLANIDRFRVRTDVTILAGDLGPDHARRTGPASGAAGGPLRNQSLLGWDDGFDVFEGEGESWLTARHGEGINILTVSGGVRAARTVDVMRAPIRRYYRDCALGNCTLCNYLELYHYSFAKDQLYWWLGPAPDVSTSRGGN